MNSNECVLFSGPGNAPLSKSIADALKVPLNGGMRQFADGENWVELEAPIRDRAAVYVLSSYRKNPDHGVIQACLAMDAMVRGSAGSVTLVVPYFSYARQDAARVGQRIPISARVVARMFETYADRVMLLEPHSKQSAGFFDGPTPILLPRAPLIEAVLKMSPSMVVAAEARKLVVVSPDAGGIERARAYSRRLNARYVVVDKERLKPNESRAIAVIGDVRDCVCLLVDDIVDTAGTLQHAAKALTEAGAVQVFALAVHAVLSEPALTRIMDSELERVFVSNTLELDPVTLERCPKLAPPVDLGPFIAEGLRRLLSGKSVSEISK